MLLSIFSIYHVINIVTYLKTNDSNLNEIMIRFQDKKPCICIFKKWFENILACYGMEPNIQRNADGRRRIVVRTPYVHNRRNGSAQAA